MNHNQYSLIVHTKYQKTIHKIICTPMEGSYIKLTNQNRDQTIVNVYKNNSDDTLSLLFMESEFLGPPRCFCYFSSFSLESESRILFVQMIQILWRGALRRVSEVFLRCSTHLVQMPHIRSVCREGADMPDRLQAHAFHLQLRWDLWMADGVVIRHVLLCKSYSSVSRLYRWSAYIERVYRFHILPFRWCLVTNMILTCMRAGHTD